jgi:hypothetical protein
MQDEEIKDRRSRPEHDTQRKNKHRDERQKEGDVMQDCKDNEAGGRDFGEGIHITFNNYFIKYHKRQPIRRQQ